MSTLITGTVKTGLTTEALQLTTGNTLGAVFTINANLSSRLTGTFTTTSTIADDKGDVRDIPVRSITGTYTLVGADVGRTISVTGNVTIPASIFVSGDPITIFNNTLGSISLIPDAGVTLYYAGTSLTGTRTLVNRALCTILCVDTNIFVVTGVGIS
jgi:hypothetical protein